MSNQVVNCSLSGSSGLMGEGIKLLQNGLTPSPEEQIDIHFIYLSKGLHKDISSVGDNSIYSL